MILSDTQETKYFTTNYFDMETSNGEVSQTTVAELSTIFDRFFTDVANTYVGGVG